MRRPSEANEDGLRVGRERDGGDGDGDGGGQVCVRACARCE